MEQSSFVHTRIDRSYFLIALYLGGTVDKFHSYTSSVSDSRPANEDLNSFPRRDKMRTVSDKKLWPLTDCGPSDMELRIS